MEFELKKKHLKSAYFYLIILFSGYSLSLFTSPEGLIIIFILGLFIFGNTLLKPSKILLYALGIWIGFFIINTLIVRSFHPYFMVTYIIYLIIAWWLISYYKDKLFINYENAIYILSIISLVFYFWQIIHFESLYSLIKTLDLSQDMYPNRGYASICIYSIRSDMNVLFPQNSGFTWEPGPFSSFIALAIFFNLARNKMVLKDRSKLIIFLITLISTQSTTGLLALLVIIFWLVYSRFKSVYYRSILLPLTSIILFVIFSSTPILQNKIKSESEQDVELLIENSILYDSSYNPGRFASFQLGWIDFKNHPFVGIGGHSKSRYATQQGADVSTINGFAMIMTRYGSVGLLLFFLMLFRSGKWLSKYYSYDGYLIFPLILLIISFAFSIIETPLLITLWISSLFLKRPSYYQNKLCQRKYYFF